MPSTSRPFAAWKSLTAFSVAGPNFPSAAIPRRRLELPDRLPPCADTKQHQLVKAERHERVGARDTIDGEAGRLLELAHRLFRAGAEDAVGVDDEPSPEAASRARPASPSSRSTWS